MPTADNSSGRGGPAGGGRGAAGASGGGRGGRGGGETPPGVDAIPGYPILANTSKWTASGIVLNGALTAKPNARYVIEVYGSRGDDHHTGDEHGWGEGEKYLGTASAVTDASGKATFIFPLNLTDPFGNGQSTGYFTATATDAAGSTSMFSRALMLKAAR